MDLNSLDDASRRQIQPLLDEIAAARALLETAPEPWLRWWIGRDYMGTLTDRQRHTNRWIAETIVAWHAWTLDRDRIGSSA